MDGVKPLGTHAIDVNGNIVPAYQGEDLRARPSSAGLGSSRLRAVHSQRPARAGSKAAHDAAQSRAHGGVGQELDRLCDGLALFGPSGPNLPAQGTIKHAAHPAVEPGRQSGARADLARDHLPAALLRPRVRSARAAYKDKPGPLQIVEFAAEASV
jgi:hypothetical protein